MKIVVGLGNPGKAYAGTRHNLGFDVVDVLADRLGVALQREGRLAKVGQAQRAGEQVLLIQPLLYMNRSGEVLRRLDPERLWASDSLLVVCDDLALDPGRLRLRRKGSDGGHKGLRSIEAWLRSQEYPRLRIGVGEAPEGSTEDYVTDRPTAAEARLLHKAVARGADGLLTWLDSAPLAIVMNELNQWVRPTREGEAEPHNPSPNNPSPDNPSIDPPETA
jgi:PTH1 family peptidyl-tRNA hydrolase